MKFFDISMVIEEGMQVYPGNPPVKISRVSEASAVSTSISQLSMGSHTGTHVDAPRHVKRGAKSVDRLALDHFYGKCAVVDVTRIPFGGSIAPEHVRNIRLHGAKIVVFKSRNSGLKRFRKDYVFLDEGAASLLAKRGVRTVGVDYLSVQKFRQGYCAAHCALLQRGVAIVEGLRLKGVPAGRYVFCGAPLKVRGGDGAPARAFLIK